MEKTHWKKLNNPDYIGAYELMRGDEPIELNVELGEVSQREVKGADGKTDICLVADLKGLKPFIINSTNAKMISKLLNTPYVQDWKGKTITLYVKKIKAFGDVVEALRVKDSLPATQKPELNEQHPNWSKCQTAKQNGTTIEQLRTKYTISDETFAKL
jgi:hypothetical protein